MKYKILIWLPVVVIASIIFWFSDQPYQEQDVKPFLGDFINEKWIEGSFDWVQFDYAGYEVSTEKLGGTAFVEFFIRKGAHFGIFFLLGFFTYRALIQTLLKRRITTGFISSIVFVFIYAVQDELHQHFTGNRTPLIHDVGIDTIGGIVGISLYMLFNHCNPKQ
ncbi:VanZ family protein [Bacillus suaedaesalsae]|uniref:VanZ family protein n=1 Tax=Bacillus suaedaesalsae TaxID=2810349 RepID=A0ABS2DL01_9BACI|nr:VanZ family protein [Bacillus suaedaesalsae]MBM6619172.1 VanZ family protein [Bacillus suaedaesalsae]